MGKLITRKAGLCLLSYLLVIVPTALVVILAAETYVSFTPTAHSLGQSTGGDTEVIVFMLALMAGFLLVMLLLLFLGIWLRGEAEYLGEEWPPRITE